MWPVLECEWCGETARMAYAKGQWAFPLRMATESPWQVVEPSPGYTGGSRIACSDHCADEIRSGAMAEADSDAALAADEIAPAHARPNALALSEEADRWRRVRTGW